MYKELLHINNDVQKNESMGKDLNMHFAKGTLAIQQVGGHVPSLVTGVL